MHKMFCYIPLITANHLREKIPSSAQTRGSTSCPRPPQRPADTIEFPTFDASQATDQMRVMAEKGVEQTKGSLRQDEGRRRDDPEGS